MLAVQEQALTPAQAESAPDEREPHGSLPDEPAAAQDVTELLGEAVPDDSPALHG